MSWVDLDDRGEQMAAAFMAQLATLPAPHVPRDPMQIWWKAQLLQRWDAERQVVAPLDFVHPIEVAAGIACLALLLYRAVPFLF